MNGIVVQEVIGLNGSTFFAEVEPGGRGPLGGWWYEVHERHQPDEQGFDTSTWAYISGGSGGSIFPSGACRKRRRKNSTK